MSLPELQKEDGAMQEEKSLMRHLPMALTLARLALIPPAVHAISNDNLAMTSILMGAMVATDYADGAVARAMGENVDNSVRRIGDGIVDRLTTWSCIGALIISKPEMLAWYAPLAVDAAAQAILNIRNYRKNKTVLVGTGWHKTALLSQVFLAGSVLADAPTAATAVIAAGSYSLTTAHLMSFLGASRILQPQKENTTVKVRGTQGLKKLFSSRV